MKEQRDLIYLTLTAEEINESSNGWMQPDFVLNIRYPTPTLKDFIIFAFSLQQIELL